MSKIVNYPSAGFQKSLELSKAVDTLGDNSSADVCAQKMGKKMSGGFKDLIAAAVKYGFILNKKGKLALTDAYKEYKLSYNDDEANKHLQGFFLKPQLFQEIYDKYKNVGLPVDVLDKALVREFGVPDKHATRTSTYFISGARFIKLLNEDNTFNSTVDSDTRIPESDEKKPFRPNDAGAPDFVASKDSYSIKITGPGVDTTISITEDSDFDIIDAILKKVRSKVSTKKELAKPNETPESSD